jgi:hypothetical protein
LLRKATRFAQAVVLCVVAAMLATETGFALQCHRQQRDMKSLLHQARSRQAACLELGWRWEAEDQENQYKSGDSAGTRTTVGPISGFVMDVTEDEDGHAEGQCHALHASYRDLAPQ